MSTVAFIVIQILLELDMMPVMEKYYEPAEFALCIAILGHWAVCWYISQDRFAFLYSETLSYNVYGIVLPIMIISDVSYNNRDLYFLVAVSRYLRLVYLFMMMERLNIFEFLQNQLSMTKVWMMIGKQIITLFLITVFCAGTFAEIENS